MWHIDKTVHDRHAAEIVRIATIEDKSERHKQALESIVAWSATSELRDTKFRTWAMVIGQFALDPDPINKQEEKS